MTEQRHEERWVGVKEASHAWAQAAVEVLVEVAGRYRGLITYAELAEQVQTRTGLRTRASFRSWIGALLAQVVARCHAESLPPLTSLVVHRPGAEVDEATVQARLTCYCRFADDVPAEVVAAAEAAVRANEEAARAEEEAKEARRRRTPARTRTRAPGQRQERRSTAAEEAPRICPTCFVQLPASGICDDCG